MESTYLPIFEKQASFHSGAIQSISITLSPLCLLILHTQHCWVCPTSLDFWTLPKGWWTWDCHSSHQVAPPKPCAMQDWLFGRCNRLHTFPMPRLSLLIVFSHQRSLALMLTRFNVMLITMYSFKSPYCLELQRVGLSSILQSLTTFQMRHSQPLNAIENLCHWIT